MAVADSAGLPVAVCAESATPHEVKLVQRTLAETGVEMIAPHRSNRKHHTQDRRPLRRYCRRWKIERLFAWLQNFRRITVRWEHSLENFVGMIHLACVIILMRHL
jgi:transposase